MTLLQIVKTCVLPPASLFLLAVAGLLVMRWRRRLGRVLVALAAVLLWLVATPVVSGALLRSLQDPSTVLDPASIRAADGPGAIVVLGGGTEPFAPEYENGETVGPFTLQRVRYGAWLQRRTGKPLLVTEGPTPRRRRPGAYSMRDVIEKELGAQVRWIEDASRTTAENAELSARILVPAGVRHVWLVTHAWHMPRAAQSFRAHGLEVTPAPTAFVAPASWSALAFVPSAKALHQSSFALHEWIGRLWYAL